MHNSLLIQEEELPDRFRRVFKIAGKDAWHRRAQDLAERERQNPFLTDYLDDRYAIERSLSRALEHLDRLGKFPPVRGARGAKYFELYSFIHTLSIVYPRLSPKGQSRVRGYVRNGLKSDEGLAPFAHELAVVTQLWTVDFEVEFTDAESRARFDILARKDDLELEVDCKAASADIGRQIHRRRVIELFGRIRPALENLLQKGGGRTIDIIFPGALHGAERYMNDLASAVRHSIVEEKSIAIPGIAEISIGAFNLPEELTPFDPASAAQRWLGRSNAHAICMGRPGEAAVVAAVSSRKPDRVADGIYRALKQSAERQFSGTRPALLAIRLLDLTMVQLRELASNPSGGLGAICNRLFGGERRSHIFGVAFVSPADTLTESVGADRIDISDRGTALLFRRGDHPLAHDPRLALFKRWPPIGENR
jgi:hypothetical protein